LVYWFLYKEKLWKETNNVAAAIFSKEQIAKPQYSICNSNNI